MELLSEAVSDEGLLIFIAVGASFGVQATLTFGWGVLLQPNDDIRML